MNDDFYLKKLRELNQENAREMDRLSRLERAVYLMFMAAFAVLLVVGAICRQRCCVARVVLTSPSTP